MDGPALPPDAGGAASRTALVPVARARGWLERFGDRHGGAPTAVALGGGRVLVRAPDGARGTVSSVGLDLAGGVAAGDDVDAAVLLDRVTAVRCAAVLLLRRGGAVAGVMTVSGQGAQVLDALVRTARVQSRTAAGGWSQQRYARRRAGQAAGLARDAAATAARLWAPHRRALAAPAALLCTGGDRGLLDQALAALPATAVATSRLPRQELELRGDPRRRVLDDLAPQVGALRVEVRDP